VGGNAQNKAMKKVAGSLRLDLAQYRELEAFTKFGSELDKSTQAQLNRGVRLIEILKQPQYEPVPVEDQISTIFVAGQGLLDDIPVDRVKVFEKEFLRFVSQNYPEVRQMLKSQKALSAEISNGLHTACAEFKKTFISS